ncbi:MAG: thiamine phosphate synthase [Gammaproteobacteria bacterium]|nr:thiamine phosphate synthase [Gammaproteobacteria bacterium]
MSKDPRLAGLYAITDESLISGQFAAAIEQTLQGGSRIVQYRDKSSDAEKRHRQCLIIRQLCDQYQALFIVNDDIELALTSAADGVHLGREDPAVSTARQRLGADAIIGVSCYNQFELALNAQQAGADYVAFGAFFNSSVKPEASLADLNLLHQARAQLQLPVCCIGGINADNAAGLIEAGGDMIAVISDIFNHQHSATKIKQASENLSKLFSA